jgi:hypothetical protein
MGQRTGAGEERVREEEEMRGEREGGSFNAD